MVRAQVEHLVDRPQVQARRRAQPSGTNSPSSSETLSPSCRPFGVRRVCRGSPEVRVALCGPQGARPPRGSGHRGRGESAAPRSAPVAGEAYPVPYRTRKSSPLAPRVLRRKAVGGQGGADRWAALPARGAQGEAPSGGPPPFLCEEGSFDSSVFPGTALLRVVSSFLASVSFSIC